ncbi:hypothetical protein NDU88_003014 [Pleurodeles waltl]|uniref:Acyl-coenzyme A diphosphatase NUDT19 n=1 Tax=Pleurodeles waltl TaxID=8319 RepID=A0AAV7KXR5_PLEWA|nr:hypothetical protein NDU88_003014 [Pleurodeles waltl]
MNQALKHWREAATLILAARNGNTALKKTPLRHLEEKGPSWPLRRAYDYEVLLLKRSKTSSFMPNAHVFPGGLIDSSDFSSEWIEVFSNYKKSPNFGLGLVKQHPSTRAPIFATDRTKFGSPIPGEVAFRICAIRETFEESGILLVLPKDSEITPTQEVTRAVHLDDDKISTWRLRIQENPSQFIQMCHELHCMPNIWALHEWSNWLTPVSGRSVMTRRYDTAFFMCCLQDRPYTLDDQKEVTSFQWSTPSEIIANYQSQNIWIAPPQLYELSRMARLPSLLKLHQFSVDRALEGCERWMSLVIATPDQYIQILPGDELYPEEPDLTGEKKFVLSPDVLLKSVRRLHRIEHRDLHSMNIYVNIQPKYKHINPLTVNLNNCTGCYSQL